MPFQALERKKVMKYEAQSHQTISNSLNIGCVIAGMGQSSSKCESCSNFVREVEATEHAKKTISRPTPMEVDACQGTCHKCGKYGHTAKECRSSGQGGAEKPQCAQCGKNTVDSVGHEVTHKSPKTLRKVAGKEAGREMAKGTRKGGKSEGGHCGTQENSAGMGEKGKRLSELRNLRQSSG